MRLPDNFSFSQHNLQDYVDCKYRFLQKYIRGIEWPAVESEPVVLQEIRMELGAQFHRLVQQYFAGIDPSALESTIQSDELVEWWQAFCTLKLIELPGDKSAEKILTIPVANNRLIAKYDLLINHGDGSYTIYDWKTSQHKPLPARMMDRLQSIVYPYVLQSSLTSRNETASVIEMIYWFPTHPTEPIEFTYSSQQLENDREYLMGLVNEITTNDEDWFTKTSQTKFCAYCRYRSLCDREIQAGQLQDAENLLDLDSVFDLDFDAL